MQIARICLRQVRATCGLYRRMARGAIRLRRPVPGGLVVVAVKLLNIDSMLTSEALQHTGLVKLLTSAELLHHSCTLELSLKLLEGAFYVLAILYGYYNHVVC